jgi:hypothetical protein
MVHVSVILSPKAACAPHSFSVGFGDHARLGAIGASFAKVTAPRIGLQEAFSAVSGVQIST